jgi:hypothetical protein
MKKGGVKKKRGRPKPNPLDQTNAKREEKKERRKRNGQPK